MSNIESTFNDETGELNYSYETTLSKGSVKGKCALLPVGTKISKSSKSTTKVLGEQSFSEVEGRGKIADDSKAVRMGCAIPSPGSSVIAGIGFMKTMGVRKSTRLGRQDVTGLRDAVPL
ncbi:hypothetical protein GH714_013823 [Hevea brasiliensis]|uniref:Uncharacterized protein n=1 Tax=Hevea brasiliensis TaxID=3981 RepID=A0A6A6KFN5_HEVBR|nr:hypothetical protein GH714_013823 [Hevea brasiliensis]